MRRASLTLLGARVLLTGATGGLGGAIARALDARHARLVITGRRTDALVSLATRILGTSAGELSFTWYRFVVLRSPGFLGFCARLCQTLPGQIRDRRTERDGADLARSTGIYACSRWRLEPTEGLGTRARRT